jgi:predicted nucleic acid-binding protein
VDGYLVLDTDTASKLQRGSLPGDEMALLIGRTLCVTFVTVGEFYKGAMGHGIPSLTHNRRHFEDVEGLRLLPEDEEVTP